MMVSLDAVNIVFGDKPKTALPLMDEGLSREETQAKVNFKDRFPVDIGQEYMMDYIMGHNAGALWDRMTTEPEHDG